MYTFLFTDIEDSTRLWEQQPQAMAAALTFHDAVMTQAVVGCQGKIFKTVGDGVYAVFDSAPQALDAALTIQALLYEGATRSTEPLLPLRARTGPYTGDAEERAGDYFGPTLNRAARLMGVGHGGQVLLSATTRSHLPDSVELRDLGIHRLRDVSEPERIYQAFSPRFPLITRAIRSLTPRPTNFPAQLTSFVGREETVADLCHRLRQPDVRLLTLMGPGGIGKTRLALQIGASLLDEYEDGAFFIPLASVRQGEAMLKLIAQGLSIADDGETPLIDLIQADLAPRQMLLILDNFEQLLDAAPALNALLVAAARVKILVTSRESLYIYGEHSFIVAPLDLPDASDDLSRILTSSAVSLFVERVQAIQTDFVLDRANADEVIDICRQLDGLPLALELAAARARDLTLRQIFEQLGERLALLDRGPRDLPRRQQTMRGAIDWSYNLLADDDRRAFARLAIFEGEFFAQAAQFVAGIGELAMFVNKSLIQKTGDETYTVLAVLREYAQERLMGFDEAEIIRQKHAIYYVQWLDIVQRFLNTREQTEWFHKLSVERYNIHAALNWFLSNHEYEEAGQIVGAMWRFWATQSQLAEGSQWTDEVLAHADTLSPLIHARVTQGAGRLALLRHAYAASLAFQQTSLNLFRSIGDLSGEAALLLSLGETEHNQSHPIQAESYLGESLNLFRQLNDQSGTGRCLNIIGKIVMQHGDLASAETFLSESLSLARAYSSPEAIALALYELAGVLRAQQKYADAERHLRESLALYRQLNLSVGIATMLYSLGMSFQAQGKLADAWAQYVEAIELLLTLDEPLAIAECLIGVAGVFLIQNRRRPCIQTLSGAEAILTAYNARGEISALDQAEYRRIRAAVQSDGEWQSAWAAGQSALSEDLLRQILNEPKPTSDPL